MINWIKPEHLVSLYLILNDKEEVASYSLGNYAETLNKALKERKIEAIFLYSDKYVDEMLSDYKDYFEYNGLYEDAVTNYCTPWIKRKVSNEVLSELFTSYLSNDVLKVASDLKEKEKGMTTEEMIEVMKAYLKGKPIQGKAADYDVWLDVNNPCWDWNRIEYRVKPEHKEPTYRPYKNMEEMFEHLDGRLLDTNCGAIQHRIFPGVWLKEKRYDVEHCISSISYCNSDILLGSQWTSLQSAFENYTYLDGTPFGVQE